MKKRGGLVEWVRNKKNSKETINAGLPQRNPCELEGSTIARNFLKRANSGWTLSEFSRRKESGHLDVRTDIACVWGG